MTVQNDLSTFSDNFNCLSAEEKKAVIDAIMPYLNNKEAVVEDVLEIDITITEQA